MIQCENCETAQWLNITASTIKQEDNGLISDLTEVYECVLCGGTGKLDIWEEPDGTKGTRITGDVEEINERPRESP